MRESWSVVSGLLSDVFRGSQWGSSDLEIRLDKSGCHLHNFDRQFVFFSLVDLVGAYKY